MADIFFDIQKLRLEGLVKSSEEQIVPIAPAANGSIKDKQNEIERVISLGPAIWAQQNQLVSVMKDQKFSLPLSALTHSVLFPKERAETSAPASTPVAEQQQAKITNETQKGPGAKGRGQNQ